MSNRSGGYSGHSGQPPTQSQPEIQVIKLHKSTNGMGLSIVAAKVDFQVKLTNKITMTISSCVQDQ